MTRGTERRRVALHAGGAFGAVALLAAGAALAARVGALGGALATFVPAAAAAVFLTGFAYRVGRWLWAPVPFRIPVVTGQHARVGSLPRSRTGSPRRSLEVVARVALDAILFRPLLRTSTLRAGGAASGPWLWLLAALFHGALAVVLLRHTRLLLAQPPSWLTTLATADAALELGSPRVHLTGALLLTGATLLFLRRLWVPRVRYVSIAADYFPLALIAGIAATGLTLRHVTGVDLVAAKSLIRGVATLSGAGAAEVDAPLLMHLILVSALLAYFPASKLMHVPAALLSPTLGLANSSRAVRHQCAWNPPVEFLSYAQYEADFRAPMREAGLPLSEE